MPSLKFIGTPKQPACASRRTAPTHPAGRTQPIRALSRFEIGLDPPPEWVGQREQIYQLVQYNAKNLIILDRIEPESKSRLSQEILKKKIFFFFEKKTIAIQ